MQGEKAAAQEVLRGSLAMVRDEYEASGSVFEFYDARPHRHAIPASAMSMSTRNGRHVRGAVRDHGPTAAVALRMLFELGSPPSFAGEATSGCLWPASVTRNRFPSPVWPVPPPPFPSHP